MKIAVVGSGVSGMVASYLLSREHQVTLFEAADHIGGHTNTIDVEHGGQPYAVDTGFIVFNECTYPNFIHLLDRLGVESKPTTMSFSVKCERSGLEYNGTSLNGLFAQRRNLIRPDFHRMVWDILRFYRDAQDLLLNCEDDEPTIGEYLANKRFSRAFVDWHIVPMGAAVWSADPVTMLEFPARSFARFFHNHGFLQLRDRPAWRVVCGGSRSYVSPLIHSFRENIRLRTPVRSIRRDREKEQVHIATDGGTERFDQVVLATHSDQSLALLADPSEHEREILGAIKYQRNEAVLHTDESILPHRRRAWAAWNYHLLDRGPGPVAVTYNMNILQGLAAPVQFCVTLNRDEAIDPQRVLRRITYHHPVFTPKTMAAQRRRGEISGVNRTHYCGAYWRYGFHEDGVRSGLEVGRAFGQGIDGPLTRSERESGPPLSPSSGLERAKRAA
jgi:predicted NAD/FAD-binding protein